MIRAVALYEAEQSKGPREQKMGLRRVCKTIEDEYYTETKRKVVLDHMKLSRWAKGGKSKSQSNAEKGWLLPAEVDKVIEYAVEMANRGFPLSHQRLREHVNEICRARMGARFPEGGVGKQWSHRFVEKYSEELSTYWSRPLDTSRGRAVNPSTNETWFKLLGETIKDNNIPEELQYGVDETGVQPGGGLRERVIGPKGKKVQHQQQDGNRENITVIATICADGTSLPPAVLFKGQAFQVKWAQDNPTKAS